ncbi:MAG TPA: CbiX/SirB N-terminal domain-containing protein [Pirellulales bacterium]|jgi:sirohydrochlorin cobaltochelatase
MTTDLSAKNPAADLPLPDAADAVLIIGHGTRDPAGLAEFRFFVDQVARQRTDWHVAGCFLELAEPSIAVAVDRLAAAGVSRIRAMPLMLFSAGHVKRDIPDALAQAMAQHPGVEIEFCQPLGCHEAIVELSIERYRQAILEQATAEQEGVSPNETLLILVGRGSSDAEATAEMQRLAHLRRVGTPPGILGSRPSVVGPSSRASETSDRPAETGGAGSPDEELDLQPSHVEIGFVAMATPSLGQVLEEAARTDFRRVIVQPHLLFAGSVLAEIRRLVVRQQLADVERANCGRQWIVTEALGPDPRLVTAVVDIVSAVTPRPHGN